MAEILPSPLVTQTTLRTAKPDPLNLVKAGDNTPRNSASLTTTWKPAQQGELATVIRCVDRSRSLGITAYVHCDFSLAWQLHPRWEIALNSQNVLNERQQQGTPGVVGPITTIPRSNGLRFSGSH